MLIVVLLFLITTTEREPDLLIELGLLIELELDLPQLEQTCDELLEPELRELELELRLLELLLREPPELRPPPFDSIASMSMAMITRIDTMVMIVDMAAAESGMK